MQRCLILLPVLLLLAGCFGRSHSENSAVLRLAVTTTTRDSGLMDVLLAEFKKQNDIRVDVIGVGTGAAIKLGQQGDVDVLMVHSKRDELDFLKNGFGSRREEVMYNYFEIIGPEADPAGIGGMDPEQALRQIAERQQKFISRGDDSGTHQREIQLWGDRGPVRWDGYVESGQGMGGTLIVADQMQAYTLCDRGTFLKFKDKVQLTALVSGNPSLYNPYGILVVDSRKHPHVKSALANRLVDFIVSPTAQRLIAEYTIDGQSLFHPMQPAETVQGNQ